MERSDSLPSSDGDEAVPHPTAPVPLSGDDLHGVSGGARTLKGTEGDDYLDGSYGTAKTAFGYGGNDVLLGSNRGDRFWGGDGNDQLDGREGDDRLYGGAGDDILIGSSGYDFLDGGAGRDTFQFHASSAGERDEIDHFNPNEDVITITAAVQVTYYPAEQRIAYVSSHGVESSIVFYDAPGPFSQEQLTRCVQATDGLGNPVSVRIA